MFPGFDRAKCWSEVKFSTNNLGCDNVLMCWLVGPVAYLKISDMGMGNLCNEGWQEKSKLPREKPDPVPLWPPQIPHGLPWNLTWASWKLMPDCLGCGIAILLY
jgi:hypothetical protein